MQVFVAALQLGLTSFGGPIAHLGYFRREYVLRRRWLDDAAFADLNALCQALPGPASSQIGMAIGYTRAGVAGSVVSWLGFTLPSALLLAAFAIALRHYDVSGAGWLHGLKIVAVAVVADAVISMWRKLVQGVVPSLIAVAAAAVTLLWPTAWTQVSIIAGAALIGWLLHRAGDLSTEPGSSATRPIAEPDLAPAKHASDGRRQAVLYLGLFLILLVALPLARLASPAPHVALADSFYRSGSLVFGGGHVVLPLLEQETVSPGWVSQDDFLAGYGAAQAVPGPLFTFAAYLGQIAGGWTGAAISLLSVFLPAFLLILGVLPIWQAVRSHPLAAGALPAVQAAVVGLLLAALYDPLWVSAVRRPADAALAAGLYLLLAVWRRPAWLIVVAGALMGELLQRL